MHPLNPSSPSSSNQNPNRSRRIDRNLQGQNDIYMARYDVTQQRAVPIPNPRCDGVKAFLPLPYCNVKRYARIFRVLTKIAKSDTVSYVDLTQGIQSYINYANIDFSALRHFISSMDGAQKERTNRLIKFMASLALQLNEENFEQIPLLTAGSCKSLTMSQRQAAILIANGFFCTFEDSIKFLNGSYNTFNFIQLFTLQTFKSVEKLKCIFAYFEAIFERMPTGMITILRQYCPHIRFEELDPCLSNVKCDAENFIEDQKDEAHVDFANEFIGGGVLSHGVVQEEIRFTIAPETLVSCLLCERMCKNETILILGAQQYVNYHGYANTFRFVGPKRMQEQRERTPLGHYPSCIIAIDAICYRRPEKQFLRAAIDREIRKAFVGFSIRIPFEPNTIATGNWGCGAFNGNHELKFLIQFIAASATGRNLHYFTFGDYVLMEKIEFLKTKLIEKNVTFDQLYSRLISGGPRPHTQLIKSPFNFILQMIDCELPQELNQEVKFFDEQACDEKMDFFEQEKDEFGDMDEMEAIQSEIESKQNGGPTTSSINPDDFLSEDEEKEKIMGEFSGNLDLVKKPETIKNVDDAESFKNGDNSELAKNTGDLKLVKNGNDPELAKNSNDLELIDEIVIDDTEPSESQGNSMKLDPISSELTKIDKLKNGKNGESKKMMKQTKLFDFMSRK